MYRKLMTHALVSSLILSGVTGLLANANDGLDQEAPAEEFIIPEVAPEPEIPYVETLPEATPEVEVPEVEVVEEATPESGSEEVEEAPEEAPSEDSVEESTKESTEAPKEESSDEKEAPKQEESSEEESPKKESPQANDNQSNDKQESSASSDTKEESSDKKESTGSKKDEDKSVEELLKEQENKHEDIVQPDAPSSNEGGVPSTPSNNGGWSNSGGYQSSGPSSPGGLNVPNAGPNRGNSSSSSSRGSNDLRSFKVGSTADYNPMDPTTWRQGSAPYSGEYFAYSGTNFADGSCGIHSLANLMLKTGYAVEGFNAVDAYNWSLDNGFGENNGGMPAYAWASLEEKTGGYLENAGYYDESSGESGADWIKSEYEKGNFVIMGTTMSGIPHIIALDYVDDEGRIVTLDSGAGYRYLDEQDGGHVRYAFSFKVAGIPAYNSPKLWAGETLKSFKPIRDAKYKHFAQNKPTANNN